MLPLRRITYKDDEGRIYYFITIVRQKQLNKLYFPYENLMVTEAWGVTLYEIVSSHRRKGAIFKFSRTTVINYDSR